MAGLRKAKKYDWKDSNLALFGSDLEKNVKKASAETEEAWKGAGQKVGLEIWRIVKFKVTHWDKEMYGQFYEGDSYIILNTYKESEDSEELQYDLHFWIGKYSTQDEYGTAAYKTVELDTYLDDKPVQHREVQGHESELFKTYFTKILLLKGGADTGFRHVKPEEYKPRLLHFNGTRKHVEVKEVPLSKTRLKSDDVFILDNGLKLYQWNGSSSNKDEKFKAGQFLQSLKSERGKATTEVLEENETDSSHPFFEALSGEEDDDDDEDTKQQYPKKLLRLSDKSGKMEMDVVGEGDKVTPALLDSSDVFILDTSGKGVFVWIGKGTSSNEKKQAMVYAHSYLMKTDHPTSEVTCIAESSKNKKGLETFQVAITA